MSFTVVHEPVSIEQAYDPRHIACLEAAARRCTGLILQRGANVFHTHGDEVPPGYTRETLRAATRHVIGLDPAIQRPGNDFDKYQIGIIDSKQFPGMLVPSYDAYGDAIEKIAGRKLEKLNMFYQMEVSRAVARVKGYSCQEIDLGDGNYDLKMDMTAVIGV